MAGIDNLRIDDIVECTWGETGYTEYGVVERSTYSPYEKVVRFDGEYVCPLRLISEHEIEYLTNNLRDDRVPAWLRGV